MWVLVLYLFICGGGWLRLSSRFHSWSQHNQHIKNNRACPYCTRGSIRVPDPLIEMGWSDKMIEDWILGNRPVEELL